MQSAFWKIPILSTFWKIGVSVQRDTT
jgi:hypothetical protein